MQRVKKGLQLFIALFVLAIFGLSLFFALQKPVTIAVDGEIIKDKVFFSCSVAQVLERNGVVLSEYDLVQPDRDQAVQKNTNINVIRAFKVYVIADGQKKELITPPVPVKQAIAEAGITLGEKDLIKTTASELTQPEQEIEIIRVDEQEMQEKVILSYREERTEDNTLEKGLTRTLRQGANGTALNTVRITYHNGQEVKREVIASQTIQAPVNKIVAVGNITTVSRGNLRLDFKQAMYARASAYTYTGRNTATGTKPAVGTIAVDPAVIPLGSRLYVEGYGYGTACDTGGAVRGNRIDLFMEDHAQCMKWGVRTVKLYILQ
ncbi:MAG: DUF348 domain-containing protein [Syntrophomonadaceae bacterium]|nr:DUF348 domain-containing protein [Syntrophomonadaceae bacterium]